MITPRFKIVKENELTNGERRALDVAHVGFMSACPFYAYYFHAEMTELFTRDIPTACTDGRRIWLNPDYFTKLPPLQRVFVLAHEVDHVINRDPQRMKNYGSEKKIRGKDFDGQFANVTMDYRINAGLMAEGVGEMNPSWCYEPTVNGDALFEDVYERLHKKRPPGNGGGMGDQGPASTLKGAGKSHQGMKGDPAADANNGQFDEVLAPEIDPVTGEEDVPDEMSFKEAVSRAAAAAKAMGKLPDRLQRMVDEILKPSVDWKAHIRMLMTGHVGTRGETWDRPNRRRLALNPMVIMPGRRGYGCELLAVAVDTSGSVGQHELDVFFAELGGILQDIKPKAIWVCGCDAAVGTEETVTGLDELEQLKAQGLGGGGGTSFIPPFERLEELNLKPECLVYLTDMAGVFPDENPGYPVIWASTDEDTKGPWGETVFVDLNADRG